MLTIIKLAIAISELVFALPMFIIGFLWEISVNAFIEGREYPEKVMNWVKSE